MEECSNCTHDFKEHVTQVGDYHGPPYCSGGGFAPDTYYTKKPSPTNADLALCDCIRFVPMKPTGIETNTTEGG